MIGFDFDFDFYPCFCLVVLCTLGPEHQFCALLDAGLHPIACLHLRVAQ